MIHLEIDGQAVAVDNGCTVMDAASKLGKFIPHFCYHKKLSIAANCRMCLVQVEKAPKPLPACATPATEGMKVQTASDYAKTAQKGVMEFLLINHPLDCPICDQGGECQLQDLAVGYGAGKSRYEEEKRVVVNKNLGPLISTDMTRCIHCTRCVRFGQEVAGVMELGQAGRGEHSEILAFVGQTVDSELSGNMIDLCPVGALTSKPFRYTARTWELSRRKSISAHDGLGSNLVVQVKQDRVMRVLPMENDAINECWISDRDRFAYEGLNADDRLTKPAIKQGGAWMEVDWPTALDFVANGLKDVKQNHGAQSIGVLAAANQTLEELHLLAKLTRGLGCENIDVRTHQHDFSGDAAAQGAQYLGMTINKLSAAQSVLLIGSTLRAEQPLLANRLRQSAKKGMSVNVVHVADDDLLMRVANKAIVKPSQLVAALAGIARALFDAATVKPELSAALSTFVGNGLVADEHKNIAAALSGKERVAILLGAVASNNAQFATLHALAQAIAQMTGAKLGFVNGAANSVGAASVGALPINGGLNAKAMLDKALKAYVLLGVEAELDCSNASNVVQTLAAADMVVYMGAYKGNAGAYATVLLPVSPFTETAGTFVNIEGVPQTFNGVVKPLGDARPAWKVLRVLGNMLALDGFSQENAEQVRSSIAADISAFIKPKLNNGLVATVSLAAAPAAAEIERIMEVPMYAGDSVVRRAPSLQKTASVKHSNMAFLSADVAQKYQLVDGCEAEFTGLGGTIALQIAVNRALPAGSVRIASSTLNTVALGASVAITRVGKINQAAAAE